MLAYFKTRISLFSALQMVLLIVDLFTLLVCQFFPKRHSGRTLKVRVVRVGDISVRYEPFSVCVLVLLILEWGAFDFWCNHQDTSFGGSGRGIQ